MTFIGKLRAGAVALALASVAWTAVPAHAQSGGPPTSVANPIGAPAMRSLFPLNAFPMPQTGAGGFGGVGERVTTRERKAPDREERILINVGNKHVNAIFGGIGHGSSLALGVELTTADSLRGVEVYATAIGSVRKYRQFEVGATFNPEAKEEGTQGDFRFRYRRRIRDNFFGLGPDAPYLTGGQSLSFGPSLESLDFETNYDIEQRAYTGTLLHRFNRRFEAGVYVDFTSSSVYEGQDTQPDPPDGDPPLETFFSGTGFFRLIPFPDGSEGGTLQDVIYVPGLFTGSRILQEGVYAEYDGRNNDDGLTKGFYLYGRVGNYDDVDESASAARFAPNNYGWIGATLDARGYVPLTPGNRASLALRYFSELNNPKGGAVIPFYNLARLGGRTTLRGFETFRFYGNNSILFQGEVRVTAKNFDEDRGLDFAVFGDTGQVWGVYTGRGGSPANELDLSRFEADAGVGAIFRVSKAFAVRFDYAHSAEKDRYLFSFTRGF